MIKKFTLTLLISGFVFIAHGQNPQWLWAKQFAGQGTANTNISISKDSQGNIFAAGDFSGSQTFGAFSLTAIGTKDMFVAKFDNSGTVLWAINKGTSGSTIKPISIVTNPNGVSFITGSFNGTMTFGTDVITSTSNFDDMFIAAVDAAGNGLWGRKIGGTGYCAGRSIKIDSAGNIFVTGNFSSNVDFGGVTLNNSNQFVSDIFLAKFTPTGLTLWAKSAGSASQEDSGNDLFVDPAGNSYITGFFGSTATFGTTTLVSAGQFDVFVAKFDPSGTAVWASKAGGNQPDYGEGITVDGSGNVYITGNFYGTASFGSGINLTENFPAPNVFYGDVFVAKYNATGAIQWAKKAGSQNADVGLELGVDSYGYLYVVGQFNVSMTFSGGPTISSSGFFDAFFAKYDGLGNVKWAKKVGSTNDDGAVSLVNDNMGNCIVAGYFSGGAVFDGTTLSTPTNTYNYFLAQLFGSSVGVNEDVLNSRDVILFPNPTNGTVQLSFDRSFPSDVQASIYDVSGKLLLERTIGMSEMGSVSSFDVSHLPAGIYHVCLRADESVVNRKLVIQ